MKESLAVKLYECFKGRDRFSLKDAYKVSDKPKESIRARIYDNLGIRFERVEKGLYKTIDGDET